MKKKNDNTTENGEACRTSAEQSENKSSIVDLTNDDGLAMDDLAIDEGSTKIFLTIGISPNLKGYMYLKSAIKDVIRNHFLLYGLTKKLYPMIAQDYDASGMTVERAMRHAIESAWNRGREEYIKSVFGVRSYIGIEKPTTGEFIALVAEKLIEDWRHAELLDEKENPNNIFTDAFFTDDDPKKQ